MKNHVRAERGGRCGGGLITLPGNWALLCPADVHYLVLVTCFFEKPAVMIGAG